jgi:hypothetical protein
LPLGPDCIKYLSKTPKAPHDIDSWMVDLPASNSTNSALAARDILPMKQEAAQNYTIPAFPNPTTENGRRAWTAFALVVMIVVTWLLLFFCIYPKLLRRISSRCSQLFAGRFELLEGSISPKATYYFKRLLIFLAILLFVASWVAVVMNLHKQQRWSAVSEFLAACKMQEVIFYFLERDSRI